MIHKFINTGDKLELKSTVNVLLPDGTEGVKTYRTSVHSVLEDGRLEILMPMEQTKLILLPVGGKYDVCFFSERGIYRANVIIVDRKKTDGVYIVVAELASALCRYQRREYYRFNCLVDMELRQMTDQETDAFIKGHTFLLSEEPMCRGIIVDISGGGARFVSREGFEEGKSVLMDFTLPVLGQEKAFLLVAKVIRSKEIDNRPGEYENRVKFEHIKSAVREEIIKYIFDEDRKKRKHGK